MKLIPTGRRRCQPTFQAKIGTMPGSEIIVKSARNFEVGQKIEYVELSDLTGCSVRVAPRWSWGVIWKIEDDRLFVDKG